jgi:hypothetical protein
MTSSSLVESRLEAVAKLGARNCTVGWMVIRDTCRSHG